MYSVIIPTMWMVPFEKLLKQLSQVNREELVTEILIIDNNPTNLNIDKAFLLNTFSKVKLLTMEENIYVNPAWNLGATLAKEEYLIFLNDDLLTLPGFKNIIKLHSSHFDKEDSIYGMDETCYPNWQQVDSPEKMTIYGKPSIEIAKGQPIGWGCIIIVKKQNWIPIPSYYKIWFGDNFIIDTNIQKGKRIYAFINFRCTNFSQTLNQLNVNDIIEQDKKHYFNENN